MRMSAFCLASFLLLATSIPVVADDADAKKSNTKNNTLFMNEIPSTQEAETTGWLSIYSAYSCVCHHSYAFATRYLMFALRQGAGTQMFKASTDLSYLSRELSKIAASRHEAAVPDSSCDAQILQAFILGVVDSESSALDTLKMVILNNPNYPSLQFLKAKIRSIEFEKSNKPWQIPLDVAQAGGNSNHFAKWEASKFPLKVFVPTDAAASKVSGYKAGDGQLMRSAFEAWQSQGGGKIRFVYEPVQSRADITCAWVSDQKELPITDAVGVCWRASDGSDYLQSAKIKILTFRNDETPLKFDNSFRKSYLEEVCVHEIGHSLGLNHSGENNVMCPHVHWKPITKPTSRDAAALSSLYQPNLYEYISAAIDAMESGQYKIAAASLDKAILSHPQDSQTCNVICMCLSNSATEAIHKENYSAAIQLLKKAVELASGDDLANVREQALKNLHFAYLQSGRTQEASGLEKNNVSLQATLQNSASFLDQYGLKREALPYYEEALKSSPDDLAIREKFCFLLVMLAKGESNKLNFDEAISLLLRAKGMVRRGMPAPILDKVAGALHQAYLQEYRYDEADQLAKEGLLPNVSVAKVTTAEDDIAGLVKAAKKIHPSDWSSPAAEKTQSANIRFAYEQYVEVLRSLADAMKEKDRPAWAVPFIVRYNRRDGLGAGDPFGKMFELRHKLVALTDESTVVGVESSLPLKK